MIIFTPLWPNEIWQDNLDTSFLLNYPKKYLIFCVKNILRSIRYDKFIYMVHIFPWRSISLKTLVHTKSEKVSPYFQVSVASLIMFDVVKWHIQIVLREFSCHFISVIRIHWNLITVWTTHWMNKFGLEASFLLYTSILKECYLKSLFQIISP